TGCPPSSRRGKPAGWRARSCISPGKDRSPRVPGTTTGCKAMTCSSNTTAPSPTTRTRCCAARAATSATAGSPPATTKRGTDAVAGGTHHGPFGINPGSTAGNRHNDGMASHVALLRGINLGGRNKVPMAGLRDAVAALGYTGVTTYIQSGNVLFTTQESD